MKANPGDRVKLFTKTEVLEGFLMPNERDFIILKLDTGYNICFAKKSVKKISVVKKHVSKESVQKSLPERYGLPKVSILHTGGTIASKVDYNTGAVIARFTPDELLGMFPELNNIIRVSSRLVRNMWSEDMRFAHYNILADEIAREIKNGAEGIIITHGTDFLHYTAAALSFMFESLSVPVLLVGAQRSSDRGSSDAAMNLICAAEFIAKTDFAGVAVCMHETSSDENCIIISGVNVRKNHSSRRDAFEPVNALPLARINFDLKKIQLLKNDYAKKSSSSPSFKKFNEKIRVGLFKFHPNCFAEELNFFRKCQGLVLEGSGLGHAPINVIDVQTKEHKKILLSLGRLAKKIPVFMSTQAVHGEIDMNVYSTGRKLLEIGVLGNYSSMAPETAFVKLAWLLSNYPKKEVFLLMEKNLRGELSHSLPYVK